jgi:hypothetical protein
VTKRRTAGRKPRETVAPERPQGFQARIEASAAGRIAISGLIVWVLIALLVSNLPESELKDTGRPVARPLLEAAALSQTWNLFAPNPRRSTLRLEARLTYADGTGLAWRAPDGDPLVSEYRSYRWRKWASNMMSDRRQDLWPQVARWIAERHRREGELPTEVVLVRQFYFAPAPGSGEREVPPWSDDVLHVARYPEGS